MLNILTIFKIHTGPNKNLILSGLLIKHKVLLKDTINQIEELNIQRFSPQIHVERDDNNQKNRFRP